MQPLYFAGHIIHRSGGGILLDASRDIKHLEDVAHVVKGNGLSTVALRRLESLKPSDIVTKRPNIKF